MSTQKYMYKNAYHSIDSFKSMKNRRQEGKKR